MLIRAFSASLQPSIFVGQDCKFNNSKHLAEKSGTFSAASWERGGELRSVGLLILVLNLGLGFERFSAWQRDLPKSVV